MAARVRDHLGPEGVEIAFDASAFAVTSPRDRQRLQTVMSAMSILGMAMVTYLFGGYVDSPNEQRDQHGRPDYLPEHSFTKPQ